MTTFEIVKGIITAVGTGAIVGTLLIYFKQLKTMQRQLVSAQQASAAQNLLAFVNFIQAEDVRTARTIVIKHLDASKYKRWTAAQLRSADIVCSSYTIAGLILRAKLLDTKNVIKAWGPSIRKCYARLKPHIDVMREQAGPDYWEAFDWLVTQAEEVGHQNL